MVVWWYQAAKWAQEEWLVARIRCFDGRIDSEPLRKFGSHGDLITYSNYDEAAAEADKLNRA